MSAAVKDLFSVLILIHFTSIFFKFLFLYGALFDLGYEKRELRKMIEILVYVESWHMC